MIRIPSDGWARVGLPVTPCAHPLAARRIVIKDGRLVTDCWACAVEAEPTNKPGWPGRQIKHRDIAS